MFPLISLDLIMIQIKNAITLLSVENKKGVLNWIAGVT